MGFIFLVVVVSLLPHAESDHQKDASSSWQQAQFEIDSNKKQINIKINSCRNNGRFGIDDLEGIDDIF